MDSASGRWLKWLIRLNDLTTASSPTQPSAQLTATSATFGQRPTITMDYSEFYYHDCDGDGLPYSCPVNPVHTIFILEGTVEAIEAAVAIVAKAQVNSAKLYDSPFEKVEQKQLLGKFVIDIETNNYIPQLYDDIKVLSGMAKAVYVVYDKAHGRLITNDASHTYAALGVESSPEDEIDEGDDMFPEEYELSLPELN